MIWVVMKKIGKFFADWTKFEISFLVFGVVVAVASFAVFGGGASS